MEIIDGDKPQGDNIPPIRVEKRRFFITGLVLLGAGCILVAKQMGYIFPDWIITWQMLLICIGIYIGEKHKFRNPSFIVPILIGTVFLLRDYYPYFEFRQFIWPAVLIIAGLVMILRPRRVHLFGDHRRVRRFHRERYEKYMMENAQNAAYNTNEDYIDNVCIFGATKKKYSEQEFYGRRSDKFFWRHRAQFNAGRYQWHCCAGTHTNIRRM